MKHSIIFTGIITLALSSQLVSAGSITDTYTTGDPLTATTMENIKTEVTDNDGRIITNAFDISTNTVNIGINATNITSLQGQPVTPWSPSGSDIYFNTGNVGIGTSTPVKNIDILETITAVPADIRITTATNALSSVELYEGGTNPIAGAVLRYDGAADQFQILVERAYPVTATRMAISRTNGNVGFGGATPTQPLIMASGAYVTVGGVWTNASSREYKKDIQELSLNEARTALLKLNSVKYYYKNDLEDQQLGFIAEDVPDIVATKDRKGLSPMDITAVLTKVVQWQQGQIESLRNEMKYLKEREKLN